MLIGFTVMQHAFAGGITQRHRVRRRAARARAHRRRRHDLGLGRVRRQGLHQPGDRGDARAQARHRSTARRRGWLEVLHPLDRDRFRATLDSVARAAPRPAGAGLPPAHARRPLSVVRAAGAAGGRLRRRGDPPRRHAHRRHRIQDRRGAPAARRRARQPHRPAQPRTVPRPARSRRSASPRPIRPSARR